MIVTNVKDFERYVSLHPLYEKVLEILRDTDFEKAELGRVEVEGDELFYTKVCVPAVELEKQPLELHKNYIDIHLLLDGNETIGYKTTNAIESFSKDYDAEGDFALSAERGTAYAQLVPGDLCVLYPEDAHAPLIGEGQITKVVFKIKV